MHTSLIDRNGIYFHAISHPVDYKLTFESFENMTERSHFVPSHLYQVCRQQVQYLCPRCLFHLVLLSFFNVLHIIIYADFLFT